MEQTFTPVKAMLITMAPNTDYDSPNVSEAQKNACFTDVVINADNYNEAFRTFYEPQTTVSSINFWKKQLTYATNRLSCWKDALTKATTEQYDRWKESYEYWNNYVNKCNTEYFSRLRLLNSELA